MVIIYESVYIDYTDLGYQGYQWAGYQDTRRVCCRSQTIVIPRPDLSAKAEHGKYSAKAEGPKNLRLDMYKILRRPCGAPPLDRSATNSRISG